MVSIVMLLLACVLNVHNNNRISSTFNRILKLYNNLAIFPTVIICQYVHVSSSDYLEIGSFTESSILYLLPNFGLVQESKCLQY